MTAPALSSRSFGPFTVSWLPSGPGAGEPSVVVRICVMAQLLWEAQLLVTSPTTTFAVQLNAYSAAGTIGVSWLDPQAVDGQLTGDTCVFIAPEAHMTFSGTIGVW